VVVPVPKKALDQHRGISLLNIAVKVFNRVLLTRILDPLLRPEQTAFRRGRSTTHHLLALRRVLEEVQTHRLEAHVVFIDFKTAFDSVTRAALHIALRTFGVPDCLCHAVCAMYNQASHG
jgi:hypothetical protein